MASGALTITTSSHFCLVLPSCEVRRFPMEMWDWSDRRAGHKYIKPKAIHDADIVDEYSKQYMYFACIKFINSVRIIFSRDPSCVSD